MALEHDKNYHIFINVNGVILDWKNQLDQFIANENSRRRLKGKPILLQHTFWDNCQLFHDSEEHQYCDYIKDAEAALIKLDIHSWSGSYTINIISNSNDTALQLNTRLKNLRGLGLYKYDQYYLRAGTNKAAFVYSEVLDESDRNNDEFKTCILVDDQPYQLHLWEQLGGGTVKFENWKQVMEDLYDIIKPEIPKREVFSKLKRGQCVEEEAKTQNQEKQEPTETKGEDEEDRDELLVDEINKYHRGEIKLTVEQYDQLDRLAKEHQRLPFQINDDDAFVLKPTDDSRIIIGQSSRAGTFYYEPVYRKLEAGFRVGLGGTIKYHYKLVDFLNLLIADQPYEKLTREQKLQLLMVEEVKLNLDEYTKLHALSETNTMLPIVHDHRPLRVRKQTHHTDDLDIVDVENKVVFYYRNGTGIVLPLQCDSEQCIKYHDLVLAYLKGVHLGPEAEKQPEQEKKQPRIYAADSERVTEMFLEKDGRFQVHLSEQAYYRILEKVDGNDGYRIPSSDVHLERKALVGMSRFQIGIYHRKQNVARYDRHHGTVFTTRLGLATHLTIMKHFGLSEDGKVLEELA